MRAPKLFSNRAGVFLAGGSLKGKEEVTEDHVRTASGEDFEEEGAG